MKSYLFAILLAATILSSPADACDSKGILDRITKLHSAIQTNTFPAGEPDIALKNYLEGCGNFQGMTNEYLIEIQDQLKKGDELFKTEEIILNPAKPSAQLTRIQTARLAVSNSIKEVKNQASLETCVTHRKGKIGQLTNMIYESDGDSAKIAFTAYVDSCVNESARIDRNKYTELGNEFKDAMAWVEHTQGLLTFSGKNTEKKQNLAFAKDELVRGVNTFSAPSDGWSDPYVSYFYVGYEGTTVDDVENKGAARVGLYI